MGSYVTPPWELSIYINYSELFCTDLSTLHLFIYISKGLMGIILYLNYNPILFYFVVQIILAWATASSFKLAPVSLLHTSLIVFEYFLTFQHYKMFQVHLVHLFSVPVLDSAISSRSPGSFYGTTVLETKTWAPDVLIATRGHFFKPSQLTKQGNIQRVLKKCIHILSKEKTALKL